ncbi:hypothetical protein ES319_D01G133200v1, partial [Gossypium barbadense]
LLHHRSSSAAISPNPNNNAEKRERERDRPKKKGRRESSKSTYCSLRFLQKFLPICAINLILRNRLVYRKGDIFVFKFSFIIGYSKWTRKRSTL